MTNSRDNDVEKNWVEFWQPIVAPDGVLDLEQLKKELYDFRSVIHKTELVYDHVTGGRFSKCTTDPQYVIDAAEEHYEKVYGYTTAADELLDACVEEWGAQENFNIAMSDPEITDEAYAYALDTVLAKVRRREEATNAYCAVLRR